MTPLKNKYFLLLFILLFSFLSQNIFGQTDTLKNSSLNNQVNYGSPAKYELAGINFSGQTIDNNLILSVCGLTIGQRITIPGDEITVAINNMWKLGLFSDIKINLERTEGTKAYIVIQTKARPKLSSYQFEGVSRKVAKNLKEQVKLSANLVVTNQLIQNSVYNIKEYFTKKGYSSAKVDVEQINDPGNKNTTKVIFKIKSGAKVKIEEIIVTGNTQVSYKKIKKLLKHTKTRNFFRIFRRSKFTPDEYEDDKEKIIDYYTTKGFKDAKIVSDSVYNISDKRIGIKINISEGNKYYYRNISWTGNTKYTSTQLQGILNIKKGDLYNPGVLESRLHINPAGLDVTSLYMDDGYLFFSINPVETKIENDSIDMEIRIFEGPQATINKVKVTGNTKTHDHVVLRELRTRPGQKFSRSDIIRSQRELSQLGYFNPEKMNVIPTPNPKDGTVDIEYIVEEKPNDQIELSGGYGGGYLVGVLGLSLNNFSIKNVAHPKMWQGYPSGDGQKFSIRATSNGIYYQQFNMSFTEPWFGGKKPNSFSVTPFYSVQNYSGSKINIAGLSIGLGKRLKWPDDYFVLNHVLSYQYYTYQNYYFNSSNRSSGYSTNIYLKHVLSHSTISGYENSPIYPNQGASMSISLQWTPPYSYLSKKDVNTEGTNARYKLIEYHKWKLDLMQYIGFGAKKKFVIATQVNFGLMGLYNRNLGLSPFERFYVGGDGLTGFSIDGRELIRLRGYKTYDAVTPNTNYTGGVENGATLYNRFTMEARYPFLTGQAATIYGLAFIEGGNAQNRFSRYSPFDMKKSAGAGLRVFLPMFGLLGFDFGYGFDKPLNQTDNTPSGWHFHIYIGQSIF